MNKRMQRALLTGKKPRPARRPEVVRDEGVYRWAYAGPTVGPWDAIVQAQQERMAARLMAFWEDTIGSILAGVGVPAHILRGDP